MIGSEDLYVNFITHFGKLYWDVAMNCRHGNLVLGQPCLDLLHESFVCN